MSVRYGTVRYDTMRCEINGFTLETVVCLDRWESFGFRGFVVGKDTELTYLPTCNEGRLGRII